VGSSVADDDTDVSSMFGEDLERVRKHGHESESKETIRGEVDQRDAQIYG